MIELYHNAIYINYYESSPPMYLIIMFQQNNKKFTDKNQTSKNQGSQFIFADNKPCFIYLSV